MKASLKRNIQNTIIISDTEVEYFLSFFKPVTLKKDDFFLKIQKKCNQIAYVNSGIVRIYYPNYKGEETTCYFALPDNFVTSFSSFTSDTPSTENIQAIVSSTLLVIDKTDLEMLYKQIPATQEFGRKAAENLALIMEKRISLFLNNTAEERYHYLLQTNPLLIQTVPLQYLASYLGITPQHLSRLRKK